jgi:hypothetical protein
LSDLAFSNLPFALSRMIVKRRLPSWSEIVGGLVLGRHVALP